LVGLGFLLDSSERGVPCTTASRRRALYAHERLGVLLATAGGAVTRQLRLERSEPPLACFGISRSDHSARRLKSALSSSSRSPASGRRASRPPASGRKDPGHVVVDEVAGQVLTLVCLDTGVLGLLIGFGLFRFFDILKPWPVRQCEAFPGGLGIMADDLMAGVYGWMVLRLLIWWHPGIF
jgi:hypothetical protein